MLARLARLSHGQIWRDHHVFEEPRRDRVCRGGDCERAANQASSALRLFLLDEPPKLVGRAEDRWIVNSWVQVEPSSRQKADQRVRNEQLISDSSVGDG